MDSDLYLFYFYCFLLFTDNLALDVSDGGVYKVLNNSLVLLSASRQQIGVYQCQATNPAGQINSQAELHVNSKSQQVNVLHCRDEQQNSFDSNIRT